MTSKIDLCNMALARVGQNAITSFSDNTDAAKRCSVLFDPVVDIVMSASEWTTLIKRVQLVATTTTPVYDFTYEFQLPPGILKLIEIADNRDKITEYKREGDKLLCNISPISIKYTIREENTQLWGPHLYEAVTLKLAAELVYPLTGNAGLIEGFERKYAIWMRRAAALDNQQASQEALISNDLLIVRNRG